MKGHRERAKHTHTQRERKARTETRRRKDRKRNRDRKGQRNKERKGQRERDSVCVGERRGQKLTNTHMHTHTHTHTHRHTDTLCLSLCISLFHVLSGNRTGACDRREFCDCCRNGPRDHGRRRRVGLRCHARANNCTVKSGESRPSLRCTLAPALLGLNEI